MIVIWNLKNGPFDLRDLEEKVFSNVTFAENVHFKKIVRKSFIFVHFGYQRQTNKL